MVTYNPTEIDRPPSTPLHFNKSYIDHDALQREQQQNQLFFTKFFQAHLNSLYERQRLERSEHLYDIVNRYEDVG
jgi:hypothetical protein